MESWKGKKMVFLGGKIWGFEEEKIGFFGEKYGILGGKYVIF